MVMNKKAISPVVATALLLVVAVVAVVGFQTWFASYQSGVETQVEGEADGGGSVQVHRLEVNDEEDPEDGVLLRLFISSEDELDVGGADDGGDIMINGQALDPNACHVGEEGDDETSGDGNVEEVICEAGEGDDLGDVFEGDPGISEGDTVDVMIQTDDQVYSISTITRSMD